MIMNTSISLPSKDLPEIYSRRKLNSMYREIPLKDTVFRLLRKYFSAMTNLYGYILLKDAFEIIIAQNPSLITKEDFLSFARIARYECEGYCLLPPEHLLSQRSESFIWEWILIDRTIIEDDFRLYRKLIRKQSGITFYVPEKKTILLYEDPFYYAPTPASKELLKYFYKKTSSEDQSSEVFAEILYGVRYLDADFIMIQKRVSEIGIQFESEDDLRYFALLYQRFYNTTRNQSLRGATPEEMQPMPLHRLPSDAFSINSIFRKAVENGTVTLEELRHGILTMQYPNEDERFKRLKEIAELEADIKKKAQIQASGKNCPCPCGSGKKYKHCCGKAK